MKKSFFDPAANAKSIGLIFLILGIIQLLPILSLLVNSTFLANPIPVLLSYIPTVVLVVVSFGLRQLKLWGLYGFMALSVYQLIQAIVQFVTGASTSLVPVILSILFLLLSVWFYSARDRFK